MFFFAGFLLGLIREWLVIKYYDFLIRRLAFLASGITLAIGILDLFVITNFVLTLTWYMMIGYITGEGTGTYLGVKYGRKKETLRKG